MAVWDVTEERMGIYIEKRKSTIGGTELCCSSPNGVSHTLGNRGFAAFILQDEPDRFSGGMFYKYALLFLRKTVC